MYIKEFDIVLDIKNSTEQEPFEVVQGDSQSNLLNINLVDGLEPYDLTGTTAEIVFYKSDSTTVQQTQKTGVVILNAPDGKIQCTLKTNTIACPGKVVAEVRVLSDEVLLTSARFEFYVRKSLINDKTIESTDEFPVLTQLMQDTSTLIDQVNQIEKQVPENVVSRIDAMETGKANKNDMVQSDTISDATKYPSSVVTAAHRGELDEIKQSVSELNKNMQFEDWKTATLQNEWTGTIKYSKNGYGFAKLWIRIVPGVLTGLTVVANIPSSYRPEGNISIQLFSTEGKKANYIVYLNENGNIYLTADSNFSGASSYSGQTLFPTL